MQTPPKIVFLHIPKTAGKSQRQFFIELYGAENVYWHDTFQQPNADAAVIGGHRTISDYDPLPPALFTSLVRNPFDRVISHFSWIAFPSYGKDKVFQSRLELQQDFIAKGLDPESLEKTLRNCKNFRNLISNTQCGYLSLYQATFQGVLDTIHSNNFLVGTQDDVAQYSAFFQDLLKKPSVNTHAVNRASAEQKMMCDVTEISEGIILELTKEDQKLYSYISSDCSGLFSNIQNT